MARTRVQTVGGGDAPVGVPHDLSVVSLLSLLLGMWFPAQEGLGFIEANVLAEMCRYVRHRQMSRRVRTTLVPFLSSRCGDGGGHGKIADALRDLELDHSPAGSTYRALRSCAERAYYSHPAVWKKLGFPGAPQPNGYISYCDCADVELKD